MYRLIPLLALLVTTSGCTLIGGVSGALNPAMSTHDLDALEQIQPGTVLRITLTNGHTVAGPYQGFQPVPRTEYRAHVDASMLATHVEVDMPVVVHTAGGTSVGGLFVAFQQGAIELESDTGPHQIFLAEVAFMDLPDGRQLDGAWLRLLSDAGRLPLGRAPVLETRDGARSVQLYQIREVRARRRNAHLYGLAAGATADALFATIVFLGVRRNGLFGRTW
jgi:protein tyrosine phosphatase (PTP) superfamily phosphohydrolase (DUF442 family)